MKKQILMAAAVALALGGCSKTETTGTAQGGVIGFAGSGIDNITKAEDLDDDSFARFYVYGGYGEGANQDLFDGDEVTGSMGSNWTYTNTKYWAAGTWNFGAYSTNAPAGSVTPSWNYGNGLTLTVNAGMNNQGDLVYDDETKTVDNAASASNNNVSFTFRHLLSKIQFKFTKADDLKATKVELSNFKVSDITTNGTWTKGVQGTGTSATTGEYTAWAEGTAREIDDTDGATAGAFYVIPQTVGTFTIELTAKVTQGEQVIRNGKVTATLPMTDYPKWEEQKAYQYTAKIAWKNIDDEDPLTPETLPIVFEVTELDGWDDAVPAETDITDITTQEP